MSANNCVKVSNILFGIGLIFIAVGCSYKNSVNLFKHPESFRQFKEVRKSGGYIYSWPTDSLWRKVGVYKIKKGDNLSFQFFNFPTATLLSLYSLQGRLQGQNQAQGAALNYESLVDVNGEIDMPGLGRVKAEGSSIIELRNELEKRYSDQVDNPRLSLQVTNLRAYLVGEVRGGGPVALAGEVATLNDVVGATGGLGDAARIKYIMIIRGDPGNPKEIIYLDLSRFESINETGFFIIPQDLVYVQTRPTFSAVRQISPIIALAGITNIALTLLLLFSR